MIIFKNTILLNIVECGLICCNNAACPFRVVWVLWTCVKISFFAKPFPNRTIIVLVLVCAHSFEQICAFARLVILLLIWITAPFLLVTCWRCLCQNALATNALLCYAFKIRYACNSKREQSNNSKHLKLETLQSSNQNKWQKF